MERYKWSRLGPLQLGRYPEYLVKMEFTLYGFGVYTAEVDDKGIDFVIRMEHKEAGEVPKYRYYDVQVKSIRGMSYIYFLENKFALWDGLQEKFVLRDNLLVAVGLFTDGDLPRLYLIPAKEWNPPNGLFVDRDYEGLKSKPEYGLNISKRNLPLLERYKFENQVEHL